MVEVTGRYPNRDIQEACRYMYMQLKWEGVGPEMESVAMRDRKAV